MLDIAFTLIVPILLGLYAGMWLDKKLHFKFPLFTIGGFLIGMVSGFYSVYKRSIKS